MHFTPAIASAIIFFSTAVLAAPLPQLAGEGAAANSILSSTDNGIGFGVKNAEDNTADLISKLTGGIASAAGSIGKPAPVRRQLAGEGAAANSILSSTDNGIGYGVENAEDNIADLITKVKGGATSGGAPAGPPHPPRERRQLDKIANGLKNVGNAAGVSVVTDPIGNVGDSLDGSLTSGVADAGAQIGSTEESTLEAIGKAIPRRQLDKIANGFKNIGNAAGLSAVTEPIGNAGDSLDGTLTSAAADAGAQIGGIEESTLEGVGKAVPKL